MRNGSTPAAAQYHHPLPAPAQLITQAGRFVSYRLSFIKPSPRVSFTIDYDDRPPPIAARAAAGLPPRIVSFVHPPGTVRWLPWCAHAPLMSQWEEPPIAFVRIVIARVNMGTAAAVPAHATAGGATARSKAVLRRLRAQLRGSAAAVDVVRNLQH